MASDISTPTRLEFERQEILERIKNVAVAIPLGHSEVILSEAAEIDEWLKLKEREAVAQAEAFERIIGKGGRVLDARADAAALLAAAEGKSAAKVRAIRKETRVLLALELELGRLEVLEAQIQVSSANFKDEFEGRGCLYDRTPDPEWLDYDWLD